MDNDDLEVKEEIINLEDLVISSKAKNNQQCLTYVEEDRLMKFEKTDSDLTFVSKTDVDLDYLYIDETIINKFQ